MYVTLNDVNKHFGDYKASDHVSFAIEKGKLTGLLGPSGSGKTTILRMIAGLESPDSGTITIDGTVVNDIPASKRGIGFVFQNYALFSYMTVEDNIAFGLSVKKEHKDKIKSRVNELIELVGLKGMEKRFPSQLSGGQRQRVAFARAIAPNPKLLLLDEPFAAIDAKVRVELRTWLKEMIEKLGITSIFVTHDQDEAIEVADQIIILDHGRVEQSGTPVEIYQHPDTAFTASFVGNATVIPDYHIFGHFEDIHGACTAVIRPEFLHLSRKGEVEQFPNSSEEGIVDSVLFRGSHMEIKVWVKGSLLTVNRPLEAGQVEIGEKVHIFIYQLFVTCDDKVYHLKNEALYDDSVVI